MRAGKGGLARQTQERYKRAQYGFSGGPQQPCQRMRLALQALNDVERGRLLRRYAIGGAMGATFYLEPVSTFDLDIFVVFPQEQLIQTLTPICEFLRARGYQPHGESVVIGNWPVQFLPAETPLLREAVEQAPAQDYEGVPTRVMSAEHLMTIALQAGRAKDHARLVAFVEAGVADVARLEDILARHGLREAWHRFKSRYLDE